MTMNMRTFKNSYKKFIVLITIPILCLLLLLFNTTNVKTNASVNINGALVSRKQESVLKPSDYNVWIKFSNVNTHTQFQFKFYNLLESILNVSSIPVKFHVISDPKSQEVAETLISKLSAATKPNIDVTFYDVKNVRARIDDISSVLIRYFSGSPGSYFHDALFYVSLGLDRIAPASQDYAVMLDCDLYFKDDIALLFDEFNRFKSTALFGLAPELAPTYRDVLREYRKNHNTTFGDYYNFSYWPKFPHPRGFPGYNGGVILLNLHRIREWSNYSSILTEEFVKPLVAKYMFINNLIDQDFFSILGYEYPDLFQTLNCGFNRQLCLYWNRTGYEDVFEYYFKCNHKIVILHGNCNAKLPNE